MYLPSSIYLPQKYLKQQDMPSEELFAIWDHRKLGRLDFHQCACDNRLFLCTGVRWLTVHYESRAVKRGFASIKIHVADHVCAHMFSLMDSDHDQNVNLLDFVRVIVHPLFLCAVLA